MRLPHHSNQRRVLKPSQTRGGYASSTCPRYPRLVGPRALLRAVHPRASPGGEVAEQIVLVGLRDESRRFRALAEVLDTAFGHADQGFLGGDSGAPATRHR